MSREVRWALVVGLGGWLLSSAVTVAKEMYSPAEAQDACAQLIPQSTGNIFGRTEARRESQGGVGLLCKVYLNGATPDQNLTLWVVVMDWDLAVQKFRQGERAATGQSIAVDGLEAIATVEWEGDRVKDLVIEGVQGNRHYLFSTWPTEMTHELYQQSASFMRGFVANLGPD
jgi:hypothetical protein